MTDHDDIRAAVKEYFAALDGQSLALSDPSGCTCDDYKSGRCKPCTRLDYALERFQLARNRLKEMIDA